MFTKCFSVSTIILSLIFCLLSLSACLPDYSDRFDQTLIPISVGKHNFEIPRNYLKGKHSFSILLMVPSLEPRNPENDKQINNASNHVSIYMNDFSDPKYKSSDKINANNQEDQLDRLSRFLSDKDYSERRDKLAKAIVFSKQNVKQNSTTESMDLYLFGSKKKPDFILLCTSKNSRAKIPYCRYDGVFLGNLTLTYIFPMTSLNQATDIHSSILNLLTKFYKDRSDDVSTFPERFDGIS